MKKKKDIATFLQNVEKRVQEKKILKNEELPIAKEIFEEHIFSSIFKK